MFCFGCELAEAFLDCVLAVEPRVELAPRFEEPLDDLPEFFAAVRLALLALLVLPSDPPPDPLDPAVEPAVELAEASDDEELPRLLAALEEPDEDDCERAAALGGCGATGVDRMESSATRNHSLRPDAL